MITTHGYAASDAKSPLAPFSFTRRAPGDHDVLIDIVYCGICHSDIHQARDEWGGSLFPMVPGHEIVGKVRQVGSQVTRFAVGDTVGVGCFVDSCRTCHNCASGEEQFCSGEKLVFTYNSTEKDNVTPVYGGYSKHIVVDERYVLKVAPHLPLERVAPLLCAGITTYSPLKHWGVGKGHRVGVMGLGGLGHMGIQFAAAMGAEVTVFSSSAQKAADATRLGAHHFVNTKNADAFSGLADQFDVILDTISAPHNLTPYLETLKIDGALVLLGVPPQPFAVNAHELIYGRKKLTGSLIGGIAETQEMLDYCAQHQILSEVEVIAAADINTAYERTLRSDVRYRFVIDINTI